MSDGGNYFTELTCVSTFTASWTHSLQKPPCQIDDEVAAASFDFMMERHDNPGDSHSFIPKAWFKLQSKAIECG